MARTFFHFEWFPLSTPYTANSPSLETRAASNMWRSDCASEAKLMWAEFSLGLFSHSLVFCPPAQLTKKGQLIVCPPPFTSVSLLTQMSNLDFLSSDIISFFQSVLTHTVTVNNITKHQHFNSRIWKHLSKLVQATLNVDWPFTKYVQHWKPVCPDRRKIEVKVRLLPVKSKF